MDVHLLATFAAAVALLSVTPGPDLMFILANAATGGRRAGLVAALGMSTGLLVHTVAAALGLGAMLAAAPAVLDGLRWAGAAFLAYLAVGAWRSSRQRIVHQTATDGTNRPQSDVSAPPAVEGFLPDGASSRPRLATGRSRSTWRVYTFAVLTNLANPKVVLFYLAFLPQFLATGPGHWPATVQFLVLGLVFIAIGLCVDASAGVLTGTLRQLLIGRDVVRRWLDRASAAIYAALAIRLCGEAVE